MKTKYVCHGLISAYFITIRQCEQKNYFKKFACWGGGGLKEKEKELKFATSSVKFSSAMFDLILAKYSLIFLIVVAKS